jgi:hypothetical protein
MAVVNSGTVTVQTGTVRFGGGSTDTGSFGTTGTGVVNFDRGVHQLQASSSITGNVLFTGLSQNGTTDVITVSGTFAAANTTVGLNSEVVFNTTGTTGTLTVSGGGMLEGNGTLTVTGAHTLTSGTMRGSGKTILQGNGTISSLNLDDDRLVQIQGTTTWIGTTSDRIWLNRFSNTGNGGTLAVTATGIFDIQVDAIMDDFSTGVGGQFSNAGLIRKTVGTGITGLDVQVVNSGTVTVQTGTVRFGLPAGFTNAGAIAIKSGALVTVSGNYAQTNTGSFGIDIGGTTTSQFGRMTVTGSSTLDGTLNVALVNGFTPALNNRFRFMTFTSRTGFFSTQNGLNIGGGLAFQVDQSIATALDLVTVSAPAAPGSASTQSDPLVSDGSMAFVQQSWVKDFVTSDPTLGEESQEDELLIALPA